MFSCIFIFDVLSELVNNSKTSLLLVSITVIFYIFKRVSYLLLIESIHSLHGCI